MSTVNEIPQVEYAEELQVTPEAAQLLGEQHLGHMIDTLDAAAQAGLMPSFDQALEYSYPGDPSFKTEVKSIDPPKEAENDSDPTGLIGTAISCLNKVCADCGGCDFGKMASKNGGNNPLADRMASIRELQSLDPNFMSLDKVDAEALIQAKIAEKAQTREQAPLDSQTTAPTTTERETQSAPARENATNQNSSVESPLPAPTKAVQSQTTVTEKHSEPPSPSVTKPVDTTLDNPPESVRPTTDQSPVMNRTIPATQEESVAPVTTSTKVEPTKPPTPTADQNRTTRVDAQSQTQHESESDSELPAKTTETSQQDLHPPIPKDIHVAPKIQKNNEAISSKSNDEEVEPIARPAVEANVADATRERIERHHMSNIREEIKLPAPEQVVDTKADYNQDKDTDYSVSDVVMRLKSDRIVNELISSTRQIDQDPTKDTIDITLIAQHERSTSQTNTADTHSNTLEQTITIPPEINNIDQKTAELQEQTPSQPSTKSYETFVARTLDDTDVESIHPPQIIDTRVDTILSEITEDILEGQTIQTDHVESQHELPTVQPKHIDSDYEDDINRLPQGHTKTLISLSELLDAAEQIEQILDVPENIDEMLTVNPEETEEIEVVLDEIDKENITLEEPDAAAEVELAETFTADVQTEIGNSIEQESTAMEASIDIEFISNETHELSPHDDQQEVLEETSASPDETILETIQLGVQEQNDNPAEGPQEFQDNSDTDGEEFAENDENIPKILNEQDRQYEDVSEVVFEQVETLQEETLEDIHTDQQETPPSFEAIKEDAFAQLLMELFVDAEEPTSHIDPEESMKPSQEIEIASVETAETNLIDIIEKIVQEQKITPIIVMALPQEEEQTTPVSEITEEQPETEPQDLVEEPKKYNLLLLNQEEVFNFVLLIQQITDLLSFLHDNNTEASFLTDMDLSKKMEVTPEELKNDTFGQYDDTVIQTIFPIVQFMFFIQGLQIFIPQKQMNEDQLTTFA